VFYVADSLFEQFRKAREENIHKLEVSVGQKGFNLDMEMNLDTLKAYLAWKFPDREREDQSTVSSLLSEIKLAGIKNYGGLDEILEKDMQWLLNDEEIRPPSKFDQKLNRRVDTTFNEVGVVRVILRHEGLIP
jgi:hypothetical protein